MILTFPPRLPVEMGQAGSFFIGQHCHAQNDSRGSSFILNATGISRTVNQIVKTFGDNNIADTITGGTLGLTPQQ